MARLKQAKEEAEKEIAEFRAHMEAEFQKKLAAVNCISFMFIIWFCMFCIHAYTWYIYCSNRVVVILVQMSSALS